MESIWHRYVGSNRKLILDYARAFSGDGARVFISLAYFLIIANQLSIADFGRFATASSVGIVLSRIAAFGFLSPLYRIATVKPHLVGVYAAGYATALIVSLPLVAVAALLIHPLFFAGAEMAFADFALIVAAEVLFWRQLEIVISVNNGLNRFGRASICIVVGITMKLAAALVFWWMDYHDLGHWALLYICALAVAFVVCAALFFPRRRWRFRPRLYLRRLSDAAAVCVAEVLFYAQLELDKLVVLAIGGAETSGIYAIIMRLVDLTALPVRTFTMMLVQRIMRAPEMMRSWSRRLGVEAAIFLFSTTAMGTIGTILWLWPTLLGRNVALAAPLVVLALLVPGFRNLVEYQAELLYARGQTVLRAVNFAVLGAMKGVLLLALLSGWPVTEDWLPGTNVVFALLYLASAAMTYSAMRLPARRV